MRRLLALLAALLLAAPSHALVPQRATALGAQAFHGPGSRGFLPMCSGTFSTTNVALQSNSFGTTPWALAGAVVAAPTITSTTTTAPDGSATASTLSIPIVTGAGAESVVYQQLTNAAFIYAYTVDAWVKNNTPANGNVYVTTVSNTTTNFNRVLVPPDGIWHHVSFLWPGNSYPASGTSGPYLEIGVDTRDTTQLATTGAISLSVWHVQVAAGRGGVPNLPYTPTFPYVATTTATVAATQTIQCPPNVAYRDFQRMQAYTGNPSPIENNPADPYTAGGVSGPYVAQFSAVSGVGGGQFYAFANSTDTNVHNHWCSFALYAGTPYKWTQVSPAGSPLIVAPGSSCPTGTVGTGNVKQYMLHPFMAQNGCTVSSVFYPYCFYFSANGNAANSGLYMAYASAITGPYTLYGGGTIMLPSAMITSSTAALYRAQTPSLIAVGKTEYLFASRNNDTGAFTSFLSSTDGVNWTFQGTAIAPPLTGDWDTAAYGAAGARYGTVDNNVTFNKCGFFEYFATAEFGTPGRSGVNGGTGQWQQIGYYVSDDVRGPWFKFNGPNGSPSIPAGHGDIYLPPQMWNGAKYLGDSAVIALNGMFIWTGNYDDSTTYSRGQTAMMPDACVY